MPRIRSDNKGLYIKFRGTFARPTKDGQTSPLAPKGTHLRESALVEVKQSLGDSRKLLVDVVPNGKYVIAEGKFTEVWYLEGEVKATPPPKKATWKGKKRTHRGKSKRPTRSKNVGAGNSKRKKVVKKKPNPQRGTRNHLGRSKVRSN